MPKKIKLLGVKVDKKTFKDTSLEIINMCKGETQNHISTLNPEIILKANKDSKYKKILNHCKISTADGTGILWAAKFLKSTEKSNKIIKIFKFIYSLPLIIIYPKYIKDPIPELVTGSDIFLELAKKAEKENIKIFLLGAMEGVAEKTQTFLEKKFKKIKIVGTHAGNGTPEEDFIINNKIISSEAELLFVAYGAPKQEKWIYRNLKKIKNVKVAIGVGGTFDFYSNTIKRAPKTFRNLHLEWLYRLIKQPKRINRIFNATIVFPIKILKSAIKN